MYKINIVNGIETGTLECDICCKPIEKMESGIIIATNADMSNGLPRDYKIVHKGLLSEDKKSWIRKPCEWENDDYSASFELTQVLMYLMHQQSTKWYRKQEKMKELKILANLTRLEKEMVRK
jgi:hypothetical protein